MYIEKAPFVLYGGDYNPEQWDDKTLEEDILYFKKAHINLVTLPVFAWAKIEPKEGVYEFGWLDKILNRLWKNGIYVCLATPTTAQPAWLSAQYPEVLPVDIAGRKRTHGMRVFFCVNSEKYRERAAALAEEMGKRYAGFPGLVAWHVSNEYGTYCYCENCQKKFRQWLAKRYGSIEALNERWNTSFWGRTVTSFEEIMLPTELNDDYRFQPNVQLDYMRFVTDSTLECYLNEADILKRFNPELPVFSNISGYIKKLNQFKLVEHMDCAGWDNYPSPKDERSFPALKHTIMRALKGGDSFIITEQSPNQQNWQPYNKLKRPGEIRRLAFQGLAHGADACWFFQMRQSIAGQEKLHGAFISHADREDTRTFQECVKLGKELAAVGDAFLGGRVEAEVGILFDWENWWALELCSGPTKDMDYLQQVHSYYKGFYYQNIAADIVRVDDAFEKYKVLVAPLLYMMKEGVAEKISRFVKEGGTLITTYRTGMADENDRCIFGAYPGPLREVLGIWVEECDALYPEERNVMRLGEQLIVEGFSKASYECSFLCDVVHADTAEVLAVYGKDFYEGTPCVTRNQWGDGEAYYLASQPEEGFFSELANRVAKKKGISPVLSVRGDVEVTSRKSEKGEVFFLINHGTEAGSVFLGDDSYTDLIGGEKILAGEVEIAGGDVMVLKVRG